MEKLGPYPTQLPGLTKYVSFVDESGHGKDPNQRHLCLAGLLATEDAWNNFDVEWRTKCAAAALAKPFHMNDFAARRGDFAGWREEQRQKFLSELISTIRHAQAIPIGSVVSIEGFNALPPHVSRGLRDPHFLAFQSLTYHIAVAAGIHIEPGPVTMVYAHHPEHSGGLGNTAQLWKAVREHNPWVAMFMESYLSGQQAEYPGLQAADLWAYELRHHFDVIRPGGHKPRWPFIQLVGLGLNYDFTHDFISYHDENGLNGLGKMSRVQRWGEIDLYKPGFVGLPPSAARSLDKALRNFAENLNRQTKVHIT